MRTFSEKQYQSQLKPSAHGTVISHLTAKHYYKVPCLLFVLCTFAGPSKHAHLTAPFHQTAGDISPKSFQALKLSSIIHKPVSQVVLVGWCSRSLEVALPTAAYSPTACTSAPAFRIPHSAAVVVHKLICLDLCLIFLFLHFSLRIHPGKL